MATVMPKPGPSTSLCVDSASAGLGVSSGSRVLLLGSLAPDWALPVSVEAVVAVGVSDSVEVAVAVGVSDSVVAEVV